MDCGTMNIIITTTLHAKREDFSLAEDFCLKLGAPFINRQNKSIKYFQENYNPDFILVVNRERPILISPEGKYFFHPSMSKVRIKSLQTGKIDQMVIAMDLKVGDSVLDCTLGLAADAIVSSYRVGPQGKVVGLEAVPVIAILAGYGLSHYVDSGRFVNDAMRRVTVKNADHREFLRNQKDNSFDIVYIDPMFRKPQYKSDCMRPIRNLAEMDAVTKTILHEALRVCRKRVVFKERRGSKEFARLGITELSGGKYSAVQYGVIRKDVGL